MRVVILHDELGDASRADELDALNQAELVRGALAELGHASETRSVGLNLGDAAAELDNAPVDLVFNLVESLAGHGRLLHVVPACLEAWGIAFTGSGSSACLLTTDKPLAKRWMHESGIATPRWRCPPACSPFDLAIPCECIVKPSCEDASVGIDDGAVLRVEHTRDLAGVFRKASLAQGSVFAEEFIDGREFNLSLLADGDNVEVLPPAEIEFLDFPRGKPRIVGYQAKWESESFEYGATPRGFEFSGADAPLLQALHDIAVQCWHLFDLRGYARVDFRVDASGKPWVIEVNANPCLSADAGFMAAAHRRGLSGTEVVERIVAASIAPTRQKGPSTNA